MFVGHELSPTEENEMNAMAISIDKNLRHAAEDDEVLRRCRHKWMGVMIVSGFLGIGAGIVGGVMSIIAATRLSGPRLSTIGVALVAAAFPLFILAAHSMDKIGEADKKVRLNRSNRSGLQQ